MCRFLDSFFLILHQNVLLCASLVYGCEPYIQFSTLELFCIVAFAAAKAFFPSPATTGIAGGFSIRQKKEGFCLLFFVRRRRRTSRPREKNDETAEQGRRVARNAPPRVPPSGVSAEPCCPHRKKRSGSRPFAAERADRFFPQSPFPYSDDQPPLTTSKGAAFFHINAQSFGMLANPFARSSSVGI